MNTEYIIVGQGICGTMLSWFLYNEGKRFVVFDDARKNSASRVAAGIINPVTGRRYVTTWMIEEVMPFALDTYNRLAEHLQTTLITPKSIIDFFPSPQMRNAFIERLEERPGFLHAYPDQNHFNQFFNYEFGCGEVRPAYTVHLQHLLFAWRNKLTAENAIIEEPVQQVEVTDAYVECNNIKAQKIIFCDGSEGVANTWFKLLPFAPNKGEALIVACENLSNEHIFKKGMMLVPLPEPNTFWIGSNYQWMFENDFPSEAFLNKTTALLQQWLKQPFKVLQHNAAIRPATLERRPFVGLHPAQTNVGILNGMGTKGSSLAPYFANQLVQHMVYGAPIEPTADVQRFKRILSK